MKAAFDAGQLERDFIAIVRFQGPAANGMPELHTLTPPLAVLQDRGFKVALVTDGRMSGASGKVPSAIHVSPEGSRGGPIAKVRDGDVIVFDAERGVLDIKVDPVEFEARSADEYRPNDSGMGLWERDVHILPGIGRACSQWCESLQIFRPGRLTHG